jgi:hypothetical protein
MGVEAMWATLGVAGVIIAFLINTVVNACVLWFVVNFMVGKRGDGPFLRCIACAALLFVVIVLALLCLLIPIPLVNLVLAIFVWYKGSIAVIEGCFELTSGALTVLIFYLVVGWLVAKATSGAMG